MSTRLAMFIATSFVVKKIRDAARNNLELNQRVNLMIVSITCSLRWRGIDKAPTAFGVNESKTAGHYIPMKYTEVFMCLYSPVCVRPGRVFSRQGSCDTKYPEKVQVGNDQEKAQSEKNPTPKTEVGKTKLTIRYFLLRKHIVSRVKSYNRIGGHSVTRTLLKI